jgi:hypothetical protein
MSATWSGLLSALGFGEDARQGVAEKRSILCDRDAGVDMVTVPRRA